MNNLQLNSLCRVCLCKNSKMFPLHYTFREAADSVNNESEDDDILIQHALSALFSYKKEPDTEKCPQQICSMCIGILKIAYDFKILFEESQQVILQCLGDPIVPKDCALTASSNNIENQSNSSVELIVGSNKYDLKDLVIVEQENCCEEDNFGGFLKNLGTQVTATFTESHKKYRELGSSVEEIVRENVVESDYEQEQNDDFNQYIVIESDNINDTIIHVTEDDSVQNVDSSQINANCDHLIKSAMNLKYECSACQKVYSSKTRFQKHVRICEQTTLMSNFQCDYCSKSFGSLKCLNSHLKSHDNIPNISCEFCDQTFKTKSSLKYHRATKHSESRYVCQVCGKKFAVATTLNAHMQVHDKNKTQCICPVCGKTFHYKGGLFYHMKQHTNERKYHCDYCEKTFYTLTAKKRHTLTHTGARPYECQFCQKRFFSTGELKKHVYIHTGVLPYKCKYCGKGFRSSFNMKVHWFNHTGSSVCDYCYRGFISKDVLQFHYKIKHKNAVKKKKDT